MHEHQPHAPSAGQEKAEDELEISDELDAFDVDKQQWQQFLLECVREVRYDVAAPATATAEAAAEEQRGDAKGSRPERNAAKRRRNADGNDTEGSGDRVSSDSSDSSTSASRSTTTTTTTSATRSASYSDRLLSNGSAGRAAGSASSASPRNEDRGAKRRQPQRGAPNLPRGPLPAAASGSSSLSSSYSSDVPSSRGEEEEEEDRSTSLSSSHGYPERLQRQSTAAAVASDASLGGHGDRVSEPTVEKEGESGRKQTTKQARRGVVARPHRTQTSEADPAVPSAVTKRGPEQSPQRPVLLEELDSELLEIIKAYYEHKHIRLLVPSGNGEHACNGTADSPSASPAPDPTTSAVASTTATAEASTVSSAPAIAGRENHHPAYANHHRAGVAVYAASGHRGRADRLYDILSSSPRPQRATPPLPTLRTPSLDNERDDSHQSGREKSGGERGGRLCRAGAAAATFPPQAPLDSGSAPLPGVHRGRPRQQEYNDTLSRPSVVRRRRGGGGQQDASRHAHVSQLYGSTPSPLAPVDDGIPSTNEAFTSSSSSRGNVSEHSAGLLNAPAMPSFLSETRHRLDNRETSGRSGVLYHRRSGNPSEANSFWHPANASGSELLPAIGYGDRNSGAQGSNAVGGGPSSQDQHYQGGIMAAFPSYSATSFVRAYVSSDMNLNMEPAVIVSGLAAALNIVVVYFLRNHVLDTRDHLGLFLIGSYLIFASYYMIYYFLERFSSSFRRISSHDKKFYIIGNLLKAGIFISITPFAFYNLILIVVFDEWEGDILRNLGCIYAIPDFISMIIVKRMRWSTWIHHVLVVVFNYFSVVNDYKQENICRCVVVYAAFSSFSYCVNVLLASRFLGVSVAVAKVLSFISLVVYVFCCTVNWAWQVYYLRRLLLGGHDHWTVYVYMLLICLVMWDDLVLCRWLLNHAKSTAFAATQQLQALRWQQQQQQQPNQSQPLPPSLRARHPQ